MPRRSTAFDSLLRRRRRRCAPTVEKGIEPTIVASESHHATIRCRLRKDSTDAQVGQGVPCAYRIEARRRGPPAAGELEVDRFETGHTCPKQARRSRRPGIGVAYTRSKLKALVKAFKRAKAVEESEEGTDGGEEAEIDEAAAGFADDPSPRGHGGGGGGANMFAAPDEALCGRGKPRGCAKDDKYTFAPDLRFRRTLKPALAPLSTSKSPISRAGGAACSGPGLAASSSLKKRAGEPLDEVLQSKTKKQKKQKRLHDSPPQLRSPILPWQGDEASLARAHKAKRAPIWVDSDSDDDEPVATSSRPTAPARITEPPQELVDFLAGTGLTAPQQRTLATALAAAGIADLSDLVLMLDFSPGIRAAFTKRLLGPGTEWPASAHCGTIGEAVKSLARDMRAGV